MLIAHFSALGALNTGDFAFEVAVTHSDLAYPRSAAPIGVGD